MKFVCCLFGSRCRELSLKERFSLYSFSTHTSECMHVCERTHTNKIRECKCFLSLSVCVEQCLYHTVNAIDADYGIYNLMHCYFGLLF